MTAYGIFGDVEASPKLVRAALSDLLEAHQRSTPDDDFWLKVGVRDAGMKIYDEIIDWAARNKIYTEVVTPSPNATTYVEPAKITVTPAFMLNVVDAMRHEPGGKILALVGDHTPPTDVLRALARAKDDGTEIRDLAEAGLTLILFKGDDPPPDSKQEETPMPDDAEDIEASFTELGEYADDETDKETAKQAQQLLEAAAEEAGLNPDDYETWYELGVALEGDGNAVDEDEDEDEDEVEDEEEIEEEAEGLTRDQLVGKDIAEIKALAKAAGIEGYSKMRREPLIKALLGEEDEEVAPPTPAKKAAAKAPAAKAKKTAAAANGDVSTAGLSDEDVDRIARAIVVEIGVTLTQLGASLSGE